MWDFLSYLHSEVMQFNLAGYTRKCEDRKKKNDLHAVNREISTSRGANAALFIT